MRGGMRGGMKGGMKGERGGERDRDEKEFGSICKGGDGMEKDGSLGGGGDGQYSGGSFDQLVKNFKTSCRFGLLLTSLARHTSTISQIGWFEIDVHDGFSSLSPLFSSFLKKTREGGCFPQSTCERI